MWQFCKGHGSSNFRDNFVLGEKNSSGKGLIFIFFQKCIHKFSKQIFVFKMHFVKQLLSTNFKTFLSGYFINLDSCEYNKPTFADINEIFQKKTTLISYFVPITMNCIDNILKLQICQDAKRNFALKFNKTNKLERFRHL